jgi:uncharacterized membrane protein (GlpM family)
LTNSLIIQLIASFLVGGGFITLLSILAEKANKNISGIIAMFPSTVVLGFFFLGITTSAKKVSAIIPATLIPLGIIVLSSVIYIHLALLCTKYFVSKLKQITITLISSSMVWFLITAPFAAFRFNNLTIGILGYLILMLTAYNILKRKTNASFQTKFNYSKVQIFFRASFMGTIITLVVLLAKTLKNPFWGGIFTMYPAATFAILIVLHFYYQPKELFSFFRNAPIGSLSIFAYCLSVMILFPVYGVIIGTILAYLISFLVSASLIKFQKMKETRLLADKNN